MVTEQGAGRLVTVDAQDGGRWTSLHLAGREWLWEGPGLITGSRAGLATFIDAGGLDECFPTVRGEPDHGGLWNQPWDGSVVYDGAIEAYVVLHDPAAAGALDAVLASRLAAYKRPRVVHVVDQLPRTATGKLVRDRSVLRTTQPESVP